MPDHLRQKSLPHSSSATVALLTSTLLVGGLFTPLPAGAQGIDPVDPEDLARFNTELDEWREAWMASPSYNLQVVDWGRGASESIAQAFELSWLDETKTSTEVLRLGFALYDVERYDDARVVFAHLRAESWREGADDVIALASIWEAHMLDLLGCRSEAVVLYQDVAHMDLQDTRSHGQYGMRYRLSPYAAERLDTPFQRIENRLP